eukprot:jgi/Tetstr1/466922/TSEL_011376.t1
MSFAASALRRAASEVAPKVAAAGQRGIASTRSAAGGSHDPHYVHAETMYEVWNIKNRKFKFVQDPGLEGHPGLLRPSSPTKGTMDHDLWGWWH